MKKEVSPLVIGIVLGVVLILVVIIGYRTLATSYKVETKGSEADMERVKRGEPMYTPPPGVVPGAPSGNTGGGSTMGGYNLKPPPN